jgi:hypothetical protein
MGYRDDLQAALSRVDQLERDLAAASEDARRSSVELEEIRARLTVAQGERDRLRRENDALRRSQYALPRAAVVRCALGLVVVALAAFDVVASWGAGDGEPPWFRLDAGPVAAVGAFIGAAIIGFRGPHRDVALTAFTGAGLLLTAKPFIAPVLSTYGGDVHRFGVTSETHFYFLVPGVIVLVIAGAALLIPCARSPGPGRRTGSAPDR